MCIISLWKSLVYVVQKMDETFGNAFIFNLSGLEPSLCKKMHHFGTLPVHMLSVSNAISRYCPFGNITLRSFLKKHHTSVPSLQ